MSGDATWDAIRAQSHADWNTAPAVLHPLDEARPSLHGTLELQRFALIFTAGDFTLHIYRRWISALNPGETPGELRFELTGVSWRAVVLTPTEDRGWIHWAAGR